MLVLVNVESIEFDNKEEFDNEVNNIMNGWKKIFKNMGVEGIERGRNKDVYVEWNNVFRISVSEEFMIEWGMDIIKELLMSYNKEVK